ncbi:transposase [candidate division KSB1 bacterium]|nr:transposase [candidate division KSB1 bacterium]
MTKRKRYSAEQKVAILREHFEKDMPVADICDKYRIHPNMLYKWKKELFEKAVETFTQSNSKNNTTKEIKILENILKDRNEVIAELLQENLKQKNYLGRLKLPLDLPEIT